METKRILIEDEKGTKYYPVTNIDNIVDINNINKYIDVDNISLNNVEKEKLGDTITNIKSELKDHKHLASQITETDDKKFVTKEQLENIDQIKNKADQKEVDNLKQSGIEINKILVDALNSKKVTASTGNSLKFNANKVKNIKVGDYSIGETISLDKTMPHFSNDKPFVMWKFLDKERYIYAMGLDHNSYTYSGGRYGEITKISPSGDKVWQLKGPDIEVTPGAFPVDNSSISAIAIDKNNYIYAGGNDKKVTKISPNGSKIWEFKFDLNVSSIAVDEKNYIYVGNSGDDSKITKISSSGNKVWEFNECNGSIGSIAVDKNGYIYSANSNNKVFKISSSGNKVWELNGYSKLDIDEKGYIYVCYTSNYNTPKVAKVSSSGNIMWEFENDDYIYSMAADHDGYVYIGGSRLMVKVSKSGNEMWRWRTEEHNSRVNSIAVDKNKYIYSTASDGPVTKSAPGQPIGFKIIK